MVRASGPSKGCRTCRKRRVKCDERHPLCVRCEKGGFQCQGYGRDLTFVTENSRAQKLSVRQEALRAKRVESERNRAVAESAVQIFVPPELSHAAFKNDIQISFTIAELFSGDSKAVAWLGWGFNSSENDINGHALKALSSIYYGRKHHQLSFENEGRAYYLKMLRGLSKTIESHNGTSLDVLLAGMTASIYEMIASPDHSGVMLHSGGVGKVIELRGPEKHRSNFELDILISMRTSICLKAILDRKRCFLEKEEWKTIPWSLHPEEKTMTGWIEDILCDVPGLLEDFDALSASELSPEIYRLRLRNLKSSFNRYLKLLSDWRTLCEQTCPGACYEQQPNLPYSPFSTVLHYRDVETANGFMLYNALYITISKLGMRLPSLDCVNSHQSKTNLEYTYQQTNPPNTTVYEAAIEICRSLDYYLAPPHENSWAFFLVFPLNMAKNELHQGSAEHEWLKAVMVHLATKSVFPFPTGLWLEGGP